MSDKKGLLQQEISFKNIKASLLNKKNKDSDVSSDNFNFEKVSTSSDIANAPYQDPRYDNFKIEAPSVNLLPRKNIDELEAYRLSSKFFRITLVLILVFFALFVGSMVVSKMADSKVSKLNDESSQLSVEADSLAPYYQYGASVVKLRQELYQSTQGEIAYQKLARDFNDIARASGVSVDSLAFTSNESVAGSDASSSNLGADSASASAPTTGGTAAASAGSCSKTDIFEDSKASGCVSFTISGSQSSLDKMYYKMTHGKNFTNFFTGNPLAKPGKDSESPKISGTVEYIQDYKTDNNYELNQPLKDVNQKVSEDTK